MAKPVAVDVPGCLAIEAAAAEATGKKRVFLVDYQMPTEPLNIEAVGRIHDPEFGPLLQVQSLGISNGFDVAIWVIGERPVSAIGNSRIGRPNPHGDARDVCSVVYRYANTDKDSTIRLQSHFRLWGMAQKAMRRWTT